MTVTNELMYETLRAIQGTLAEHGEKLDELGGDLRAMKSHMVGFMQNEVAQDGAIASIRARLDRIERRLDISDQ